MIPAVFVATHRALGDLEFALDEATLAGLDPVELGDYWRTISEVCRALDAIHSRIRRAVVAVRIEEEASGS